MRGSTTGCIYNLDHDLFFFWLPVADWVLESLIEQNRASAAILYIGARYIDNAYVWRVSLGAVDFEDLKEHCASCDK